MASKKKHPVDEKQFHGRIRGELYDQAEYWAERHGVSVNEYINMALELSIKFENQDYELPFMEAIRMQQLLDMQVTVLRQVEEIRDYVRMSNSNLMNVINGKNYLMDEESTWEQ